jgi:hypothetical protein
MNTFIPIIKTVISDPKVIITTVLIVIYFEIVTAVVRYRKKPPLKRKVVHFSAPVPDAESKGEDGGSGEKAEGNDV